MKSKKIILLGLNQSELEKFAVENGESAFRGRQIYQWLYEQQVTSLDDITVLPKDWRKLLIKKGVSIGSLSEVKRFTATDQTVKLLLATDDGETIETVGIPTRDRLTICVSSQIGCSMGCQFCATGKGGLRRSLKMNEIIAQFFAVKAAFGRRPSHVVFMGMGEPLLNLHSVLSSIRCFNKDLGVGQRRITVSTVGVRNSIPKLAELGRAYLGTVQFTLALSLHASNQHLRESLIPSAKNYSIQSLLKDCRYYINATGRRVSFEYILLGHLNDHVEHAEELVEIVSGFQSHVNLIAYNPIDGEVFQRPSSNRIKKFMNILEDHGVAVSLRASRGLDQNAACGQLRSSYTSSSDKTIK